MKLSDIEKQFGVTFPNSFHKIYDTGAMEWLELSFAEFQDVSDKYINDPKAFMMIQCDCEPLFFEKIPEWSGELNEWLSWRTEDTGETLREGIKLVPFAQMGSGDLFLFVYEGVAEPKVVLYYHDSYDAPLLCGRDFDEFLYYEMLEALQWDEDMDSAVWQSHLDYLADEYRAKIAGKSKEKLLNDFEKLGVELDRNAVNIFQSTN